MNTTSTSNLRTSSTPAATSSSSNLRPRAPRLISGLSEHDDETPTVRGKASPLPSPFDSRSTSPLPASHLSRPNTSHGGSRVNAQSGTVVGRAGSVRQKRPGPELSTSSLADVWGSSWTAIQGILGGDGSTDGRKESLRTRRPIHGLQKSPRSASTAPLSQWGPSVPAPQPAVGDIGVGSRENHTAALRVQKRMDLLTRQETSYADTLGRFKRRTSDDRASMSAPPAENDDRDALAYLHTVSKDDTLAGITIKYNCSANILRKANRLWPSDTVQARRTLVLPVDACGVKGKPLPASQALDLLSSDADALSAGLAEEVQAPDVRTANETAYHRNRTKSVSTHTSGGPSSAAGSSLETELPWQHDSWVLLPGADAPTEIVRLPRRALGYFPPARRKSNSYSDFETPSTSLDLGRSTTTEQLVAISPLRHDLPQRPQRPRKPSNATNGYFPAYLAGPGGVGTMDKDVRAPGPAQDSLNKMFAKHLPDVAPPRHHQALLAPGMPLFSDEPTPAGSGTNTPSTSRNLNLENVGGAIESWMRRVATQAKDALQTPDRQRAARVSMGAPGKGAGGIGDLIEMTDEFEIGGDEEEDNQDRGRRGSDLTHAAGQASNTATSYFNGAVLRDRSKAGKSRKTD